MLTVKKISYCCFYVNKNVGDKINNGQRQDTEQKDINKMNFNDKIQIKK